MLIKLDTNVYTSKVHSFSTVSGEVEGKQLTVPDLNVSMDAMTAYRAGFSQLLSEPPDAGCREASHTA